MTPRNLFATKTIQGLYIIVISFLIQATPTIDGILDRSMINKTASDNIKAAISMIVLAAGLSRSVYGRYDATKDVYTPVPLPGRKPEDIII